jgi:endoglycosylceramidase
VLHTITLALLAFASTAAAFDVPTRGRSMALPALHAEPDPAGGRLVDESGREVMLRGVNVNALAEYWAYGELPTVFPFEKTDADRIASIGWNAVRLLVSWSRVEPEPGVYDEAYLREVRRLVRLLAKHNVYSIIDFHQDAWGPSLAARPDEGCTPPTEPAFGWDGAPAWATLSGDAPRCFQSLRELSPAVRAAFDAFFANAPGPGGVGIRTRYVRMLEHVARRFARIRSVAGYDLLNEPNALSDAQNEGLAALYAEAVPAIRAGEDAAGGRHHVVFFEPSVTWSDFGFGTPPVFTSDDQIAFAPHIYRGGITSGPIPPEDFARARTDAATFGGAPVLVGEWGSDPRRAEDPADGYFRKHQALQDEYRFSATLWTWRESCGDPHKAGDVRAGNDPYVWGEFEVDCPTNTVSGGRQPLIDELTRGWVRAAPGRITAMTWDASRGVLRAQGNDAAPRSKLVAFWPSRLHGSPRATGAGLERIRTQPAWGGTYIVARANGGEWSLVVELEAGSPSGAFVDGAAQSRPR